MTPPIAATRDAGRPAGATKPHTARPSSRRPAQRPPRRVSGPARGARRVAPGTAGVPRGGAVAAPAPLGLRLARTAARIPDARFLDRLLRGRAWIALVAVGLLGIVFIQVSMLRLNAGISRAIASGETLSRQNSTLRAEISKLDSGERISDSAASFGMIEPSAGSVNYLDARKANGRAAARAIRPPKSAKGAAGTSTGATQAQAATAPATTTATTTAPAQTAPPATQTQATQAPPTQTQATQTQATQTPPAQTQAQTTAPVTPAGGTTATGTTGTGGQ